MSFNHLRDDTCNYKRRLNESMNILGYVLSPYRYENANKCRHELGLVGGSAVSHVKGNLVDLESDLRGQTRFNSKCWSHEYLPPKEGEMLKNDKTPPIDITMKHLPACQMIAYKEVPLPGLGDYRKCH
jgi:hypothetical protein